MLGAGTTWYFLDDRNVLDWDHPSLKGRFTGNAWRFDNNRFAMNFIYHPGAGAGFYAFARANGLDVGESFLVSFGTSMMWEYVIEYNERVSINDVIVTPIAGVPIGEFVHKLGWYLNSRPSRTATHQVTRWSLGPIVSMHDAWDGREPPEGPRDHLGLRQDLWHRFELAVDGGAIHIHDGREDSIATFRSRGQFVALPHAGRPGRRSGWFSHGNVSSLELGAEASSWGRGAEVWSETLLAGYRNEDYSPTGQGESHRMGVGVAFAYRSSRAGGHDERRSWVGFPGLGYDLLARSGLGRSELGLRLYPAFGGASAPAFDTYVVRHGAQQRKTILEREHYYYGWGAITQLDGRLDAGPVLLIARGQAGTFVSQDGLDRTQEAVVDDVPASERWIEWEGRLGFKIPETGLRIGGKGELRLRESKVGDVRHNGSRRVLGIWIASEF